MKLVCLFMSQLSLVHIVPTHRGIAGEDVKFVFFQIPILTAKIREPFVVCGISVTPSNVMRDLGLWVDSGLTMSTHITKTVAGCFATPRQLRSVRRSLSCDAFTRLVVALVLSRLDYCNGVLAGLPAS